MYSINFLSDLCACQGPTGFRQSYIKKLIKSHKQPEIYPQTVNIPHFVSPTLICGLHRKDKGPAGHKKARRSCRAMLQGSACGSTAAKFVCKPLAPQKDAGFLVVPVYIYRALAPRKGSKLRLLRYSVPVSARPFLFGWLKKNCCSKLRFITH